MMQKKPPLKKSSLMDEGDKGKIGLQRINKQNRLLDILFMKVNVKP
jgi:hypothetical protein